MRQNDENLLRGIEVPKFTNRLFGHIVVRAESFLHLIKRHRCSGLVRIDRLQKFAWAGAVPQIRRALGGPGRDGLRQREVFGRSELAAVMAGVAAHHDETGFCHARQAAYVAHRVPWRVEEVEASVPEVIVGGTSAESEAFTFGGDVDLAYLALLDVFLEKGGIVAEGVAGEVGGFEARADD